MTHTDIINCWSTIGAFASDIGCSYEAAKAMRRRNVIPSGYWMRLTQVAADRGIEGVTLESLALAVARDVTQEAAE